MHGRKLSTRPQKTPHLTPNQARTCLPRCLVLRVVAATAAAPAASVVRAVAALASDTPSLELGLASSSIAAVSDAAIAKRVANAALRAKAKSYELEQEILSGNKVEEAAVEASLTLTRRRLDGRESSYGDEHLDLVNHDLWILSTHHHENVTPHRYSQDIHTE